MTTLKGVFPDPKPLKQKNFIHENVKNLRRMEQCYYTNKEIDEIQKSRLYERKKVGSKHQNVLPKMNSSLRMKKHESHNINLIENRNCDNEKKASLSASNNNSPIKQKRKESKNLHKSTERVHGKVLSDPNILCESTKNIDDNTKMQTRFKNQSIQTLETNQMDNLYSEGMIRYPSKKYLNNNESRNKNEADQQNDKSVRDTINSPSDKGDTVPDKHVHNKNNLRNPELLPNKGETDVTKLNKERTSVANKVATRLNNSNNNNPPTNYRKGVVPKYIKNRKEAQEKELKAKAEVVDPDCPNGHVPLPDQERKETLHILKKNYQDFVNELNMMPIKTDTLRSQQRKTEIEKQLNKLEEGIKVFSKPKVYVKMNA